MKAIVYTRYGPPDVLRLEHVEVPTPKDTEVLVKVQATTVNRTDCGFRLARPFIVRVFSGLLRPRRAVLGSELAGVVEEVGRRVTSFRRGDRLFGLTGTAFGAHAEYVCLPESAPIAAKPANMTYEEAAAVCDGAMNALAQVRSADLRRGQTILVNGATGSIGTASVQLARNLGAEVTAVCEGKDADLVRSLGAGEVIDRTRYDFTKVAGTYDVVLDAVGKSSFLRCRDLVKEGGCYLTTDLGFLAQNPVLVLWTRKMGSKRVHLPIPRPSRQDVVFLRELIEAGEYRAVIDRRYRLEEIPEATRYVETERKVGNVVIEVGPDAGGGVDPAPSHP
ncbi:MAG TPA: NAD(P)-dependent alcohol dehydrogenase [Thermoleophilia bacterium]|nr:NAD(P)-dependent alcohol dehydrogenase [Thermoleophilia bacterium]